MKKRARNLTKTTKNPKSFSINGVVGENNLFDSSVGGVRGVGEGGKVGEKLDLMDRRALKMETKLASQRDKAIRCKQEISSIWDNHNPKASLPALKRKKEKEINK